MKASISVIGGDSRQIYAGEYLIDRGYKVSFYGFEHVRLPKKADICTNSDKAMSNDIIILPLPVSKSTGLINAPLSDREIKIRDITDRINENHLIFAGMVSPALSRQLSAKAKFFTDYYNIEKLIYKNALLTSEGLISIILDKIPTTIFGMKIAITGFGRIAYFTAEKLMKLGAQVSIFARDELQLIKAQTMGCKVFQLDKLSENSKAFDCIINTVPFPVISGDAIIASSKDCVFIEAASAPYGIDGEACVKEDRALVKAFSLPGKTAPKSAGIIIGETIASILGEMNL